jgi:hypothetical protein
VNAPRDTVSSGGYAVGEARGTDGFQRLTPAGGTATALLNLELRTRNGWPISALRWAAFVDAGRVWNNTGNYSVSGLRVTPGIGIRLNTPLGPARLDVAYNPYKLQTGPLFQADTTGALSPVPGQPTYVLNQYGYERGPAFYLVDRTAGIEGRAICVSPGTTEPLDPTDAGTVGPVPCPATFLPSRRRSLLSRLAFHFSIGEAF